MNPLLIVWTQMDPIKDLILATRMSIILGGPLIIITNPQLFSSCVSNHIISTMQSFHWELCSHYKGMLS